MFVQESYCSCASLLSYLNRLNRMGVVRQGVSRGLRINPQTMKTIHPKRRVKPGEDFPSWVLPVPLPCLGVTLCRADVL